MTNIGNCGEITLPWFKCFNDGSNTTSEQYSSNSDFLFSVKRIGVNVDSLLDPDMMCMSSVFQNKNSLVIGFSLSGARGSPLFTERV